MKLVRLLCILLGSLPFLLHGHTYSACSHAHVQLTNNITLWCATEELWIIHPFF